MDFERNFQQQIQLPPINWSLVLKIALALVVLILVFSMGFTVEPEEVGIVTRFGAYKRVVSPGLNIKAPWPIEAVTKVPVERQLKQEFGYRTVEAGINTSYEADPENEAQMLTGDLNVAVVEWTTQYRVRDPYLYLFKIRNVTSTFRDMNETIMRQVIGDRSVNEVLTVGRQEIADEVEQRLQDLCDQYETGIKVEQIVLQDVNPPDLVKPSFNEVNQAQQEREKLTNEAKSLYNQAIPRARGQALQMIEQAEGFATDRVNRARGDADLFDEVYEAYRTAPEVTRRRMYLETMAEIYPKVEKKLIIDDDLSNIVPLLQLGGEKSQ